MFANRNRPAGSCSFCLFVRASCVITRETNDELLLMIFPFGFRFFKASFPVAGAGARAAFPPPNAGVDPSLVAPSVLFSAEGRPSLSLSLILLRSGFPLIEVFALYSCSAFLRGRNEIRESFTPAVGGVGIVVSGFALVTGASEG